MSHLLQPSITKIGYFGKKVIKIFNIPGEKKDKHKILKKNFNAPSTKNYGPNRDYHMGNMPMNTWLVQPAKA